MSFSAAISSNPRSAGIVRPQNLMSLTSRRHQFVRQRKKKVRVRLENMGFSTDVDVGIKGI